MHCDIMLTWMLIHAQILDLIVITSQFVKLPTALKILRKAQKEQLLPNYFRMFY